MWSKPSSKSYGEQYLSYCSYCLISKVCRNVTLDWEGLSLYLRACVCVSIMFVFEQRLAPWSRVAGRQGLPWSLSVIQSGVALLAIIFPVRSLAVSPPHHISLCQFPTCPWIEPRSMKPHATLIISFTAIPLFQPKTQISPLISRLWLIKLFPLFNKKNGYAEGNSELLFKPTQLCFCRPHAGEATVETHTAVTHTAAPEQPSRRHHACKINLN